MINLIIGTMFAGKSTELLKYLRRSSIAGRSVCLLRPQLDIRSNLTHDKDLLTEGVQVFSVPTDEAICAFSIEKFLEFDTIGIDEWQFFPLEHWGAILFPFLKKIQDLDKECHISGLSGTFHLTTFEILSRTIPLANSIQLESAICQYCGQNAYYTYRHNSDTCKIDDSNSLDNIGAEDKYSALCWDCRHKIPQKNHDRRTQKC